MYENVSVGMSNIGESDLVVLLNLESRRSLEALRTHPPEIKVPKNYTVEKTIREFREKTITAIEDKAHEYPFYAHVTTVVVGSPTSPVADEELTDNWHVFTNTPDIYEAVFGVPLPASFIVHEDEDVVGAATGWIKNLIDCTDDAFDVRRVSYAGFDSLANKLYVLAADHLEAGMPDDAPPPYMLLPRNQFDAYELLRMTETSKHVNLNLMASKLGLPPCPENTTKRLFWDAYMVTAVLSRFNLSPLYYKQLLHDMAVLFQGTF